MSNIALPYTQIIDPASFKSILNAKIYIGEYGTLPNPANSATWKQAYFVQDDGTRVAASQPIRTNAAGFAVDGSSNIRTVQVDGQYSLLVQDSFSVQKYSNTRVSDLAQELANTINSAKGAAMVGYLPAGAGTVGRSVQSKLREAVSVKDFGAVGDGIADDSSSIQLAVNAIYDAGGGIVYFPAGTYKQNSNVDVYKGAAKRIILQGQGQSATKIRTTAAVDLYTHAEFFECYDIGFYQDGTQKTGKVFATPTTKQASQTRYERLYFDGFKIGVWWRFSLWNSLKDLHFNNCGCAIKLSRNASPDDSSNPYDTNGWNKADGFFHNQNTFNNILINGGEVGIWGTPNGCEFKNITAQGQSSATGADNVVLPVGTQGIGMLLQRGMNTTSRFGSQANSIDTYYTENTRQPLVCDYLGFSLASFYVQGGPDSSNKYPQAIHLTGSNLDARGCNPSGADWFDFRMVAVDSTVIGDPSAGTTSAGASLQAAYSLTNTKWYKSGDLTGENTEIVATGPITTSVKTMESRNSYRVVASGLYNGITPKIGVFDVTFYQAGSTKIIGHPSNDADVTCTISGSTLQINLTNANPYVISVSVIKNKDSGQFPYTT